MKTQNYSVVIDSKVCGQEKSRSILFIFLMFMVLLLQSQVDSLGVIKVTMMDKSTKEPIPFANVVVYSIKGEQAAVGTTNMDGECLFKLNAGTYHVKGVYVGYAPQEIRDVRLGKGKTAYVALELNSGPGIELQSVEIVSYNIPMMDLDTKSGQTVTREEYQNIATKDINSISATSAGIYRTDESSSLNIRGGRSENTTTFVNGVKVYGKPVLPSDHTSVYVSPINGEGYEAVAENNFKSVAYEPLSTFSSDVDVASYANVRRLLNAGQLPPQGAVRTEEMLNYFRYRYPAPENGHPFAIHSEISECPWNSAHRLIQIGLQGKLIENKELPANNLTFLIDVSGSMDEPTKLPLVIAALKLLVEQLREVDRVAMVVYAGNAGLVLPSTKGSNKKIILDALDGLRAGGSTAGGEGIVLAYNIAKENLIKGGNNRVILATDGDFNVGLSSDNDLVNLIEEKRNDGIFLTVLGFGTGNYQEAKMEKLADKGNGNFAYVDNILEAHKILVKEMGGTLVTIAKDVKIQVDFNPALVKEYRLLGYENRMLAAEDFNNDKKDAGEVGAGHSVTALYELVLFGSKEKNQDIDELKYQHSNKTDSTYANEICTVKIRYKEPTSNESQLISSVLLNKTVDLEQASLHFKFCAAVAEFSLLLKHSAYLGKANYKQVLSLAKQAKGEDSEGYRAEFIKLCETAELLASAK